FSVRYAGFVNGDGPGSLGGTLTYTTAADATSDVGSYSVTPSGLTSSNYTISFVDGTLDITKAALSVTVDKDVTSALVDHFTKVYGQANPSFSVRYAGFVNGDGPGSLGGTLVYTSAAVVTCDVGSYSVTPSGLTSSNYTISFVDGTLDITKAALSVTVDKDVARTLAGQISREH